MARRSAVWRLELVGANPASDIQEVDPLPGRSHDFRGNIPARWLPNITAYARVRYKNVYPGVDLVYYGRQGQLEYDFVVAPGANPAAIRLRFPGLRTLHLKPNGDLSLDIDGGRVEHSKPVIYQEVNGARRTIAGGYVRHRNGQVSFAVAHL